MLVGLSFFLLPWYLLLSCANQRVRQCRRPKETKSGCLTERVQMQRDQARQWPWTDVLVKLHWLCFWLVVLQCVSGVGTNIVLAYINAWLRETSFETLCIAFLMVGITMFLIPVVPGVPVYLFGGILIPSVRAPITEDPETG